MPLHLCCLPSFEKYPLFCNIRYPIFAEKHKCRMKRLLILLNLMMLMSSCVSATSVTRHRPRRVAVVTSFPVKHGYPKRSTVVVKKIVVGTRVKVLPAKQVVIHFDNSSFIYSEGVFYRKISSSEYEVIKPRIGMVVPQLPQYNAEKVIMEGETLFLFDGTLYKEIPTREGVQYKVTGFIN